MRNQKKGTSYVVKKHLIILIIDDIVLLIPPRNKMQPGYKNESELLPILMSAVQGPFFPPLFDPNKEYVIASGVAEGKFMDIST